MYEKWASIHYNDDKIRYTDFDVDSTIFGYANLSQPTQSWNNPISALWDQNRYTGMNASDTWWFEMGLAEFTNANFVSQSTRCGSYQYPFLADIPVDYENPVIWVAEDGKPDRVYYIHHPERGYRLATVGFLSNYNQSVGDFGEDDNVWQDYAAELIPRAVGYSAALLKYFFRGSLEISAPDNFVYGIIDGSGPHEFTQIKAKVRNTTPSETVQTGTLIAVAKYRERIDYREDLYTDPPKEWSREKTWSYSVSEPIGIDSLSSDTAQNFTFDFSYDPIPVGITDLYLQVVFKGTLGNERDIAVAVGMKDLTEPTHISTWNSTDRVYVNDEALTEKPFGVLMTGQQIRENNEFFQAATMAGVYIDPHPLTRELGFYPPDGSFSTYQATFADIPAGRYGRIVILTDTLSFNMRTRSVSSDPEKYNEATSQISAAINQDESEGEFQNTQIQIFRGINQHMWNAFAWYLGSTEGIDTAAWPLPTSEQPYPATTIIP